MEGHGQEFHLMGNTQSCWGMMLKGMLTTDFNANCQIIGFETDGGDCFNALIFIKCPWGIEVGIVF